MSYRVLIPTAGTGSRLLQATRHLNKSLVSVGNRPAISHLIEQFAIDAEFVIALGHKGKLVREFLTLAYPDRIFQFVEVEPFEGPGSGLGLTVLKCANLLREPFIFSSCDTLTRSHIPQPDHNWMAYGRSVDLAPYRTVAVSAGKVDAILEKGELSNTASVEGRFPYIGLAGIRDIEAFWSEMESGGATTIERGESHGLRALVETGMRAYEMDWSDTGTPSNFESTRVKYHVPNSPNILEKPNEAIWFVNGTVIKFSADETFIKNRVARSNALSGYVPKVDGATAHMYRYAEVKGRVLSRAINAPLFEKFLRVATEFWLPASIDDAAMKAFERASLVFYRDKTFERVEQFYRTFDRADGPLSVNGRSMPSLRDLLQVVNWDSLKRGIPVRFHGDFHFENILYEPDADSFTFLDWRQDFAGSLEVGDLYYDLAKLNHGLIIAHDLIIKNAFNVTWTASGIEFDFLRKQALVACERRLEEFVLERGLELVRMKQLTALIFLNIAALHHDPYCQLLYGLGKSMLFDSLEN